MNQRFMLQWKVEHEEQMLLRDFLKLKNISKRSLTHIKYDGGLIEVNGAEATVRKIVAEGDTVKVIFPDEKRSDSLIGEQIPLDVIFEDDAVLVINKPPFMNTIPSREHPSGSVANGIIGKYNKTGYTGAVHIATRLDRNTSGLMLIAKHTHAHHLISQSQQNGLVSRTYQAIAHGNISPLKGVIDAPIGRKDTSIIEREVRNDGQIAITHYNVLNQSNEMSNVELKLETGRTHQIRVHLRSIGHPIVGDDLYGGEQMLINRQALHCSELQFTHPFSGKEMNFTADMPSDMKKILIE